MKEEMNQSNLLVFLTMIRGHVQTFSVLQKSITRYTVRIAEDDGEIDTDLPGMYYYSSMSCGTILGVYGVELRAEEKIGKFGFTSLGIVEVMCCRLKWMKKYLYIYRRVLRPHQR